MQHVANMNNKNLICCGHKVPNQNMSAEDLVWAKQSAVIQQDNNGAWYHTGITKRDRQYRQNMWKPDTGKERGNQF